MYFISITYDIHFNNELMNFRNLHTNDNVFEYDTFNVLLVKILVIK
jgi:hypothetical protein